MDKIHLRHNKDYDVAGNDSGWRTTVKVTFEDGSTLDKSIQAPRGLDPPPTNEDIAKKWRMLMSGILDEKERDQIKECVLNLDEIGDVGKLIGLLEGSFRCPIAI